MDIIERNKVFSTPWFNVVAKILSEGNPDAPYYSLELSDYVSIVALTEQKEILLVRQYRPTVERYTLELPSGHLEPGESPEDTAKRELIEETGYQASTVELLGNLIPDSGRLSNRLWCYFATDVTLSCPNPVLEAGIELVVCSQEDLVQYILQQQFDHALHLAQILLAMLKNKLY